MKIRGKRVVVLSASVFLALLVCGAGPAAAEEPLRMFTYDEPVLGTTEILNGRFEAGIKKSLRLVNSSNEFRRLASRTNLCVGYTALHQFDNAVKWCDAAIDVGELRDWHVRNNRAVLYHLMGDYEASSVLLSAASNPSVLVGVVDRRLLKSNLRISDVAYARLRKEEEEQAVAGVEH